MFVNVARATSFMAETARRLQDEVEDCDLTVKLLKYRIAALQDGCVPPVLGAWVEDYVFSNSELEWIFLTSNCFLTFSTFSKTIF